MTQETKIIGGIVGATIIIVVVGVIFLAKSPSTKPVADTSQVATQDMNKLVRPDSNQMATASAKVTLVEFGDYQCPACDAAYPTVKKITTDYANKINFVFRNFPLPMHQNAKIAAEAAEAAGAQGKYWQMHDLLYENQNAWADSTNPITFFDTYAKQLGLDQTKFDQDVKSNAYDKKISEDMADGDALGVNATPTFYLNGTQLGQYSIPSYNDFKTAIDKDLNQ